MAAPKAPAAPVSTATLAQRAELVSLGYGQVERPGRDVLSEIPSSDWAVGHVDLTPSPDSPAAVGLRLRGYYPPTRQLFDVSDRIGSLSWTEAAGQAAVQGSLTLNNSDGTAARYMNRPGMILALETRHRADARFVERYRWISWTTSVTDLFQAALTISFYDVLIYLQTAEVSVGYVKDKSHPKGWRCHEIAADLCKRFKIPVGSLAKGRYFIPSFMLQDATIYDVIAQAYSIEHHAHPAENFFVIADHGQVYVTKHRRILPGSARFVLSGQAGNVRQHDFSRSLDQYAGGIIPSGGDANLLEGNQQGAVASYVGGGSTPGSRRARQSRVKGSQSPAEAGLSGQLFPPDPFTSTNPGANQPTSPQRSTAQQRANQELASQLLFGAITFKIGSDQIPHVDDPAFSKLAAQLLADALSSAQKKMHAIIDGNILLRVGDIVYVDLLFQRDRPFQKELYISQISHSIQGGDYTQDVTMSWRERDVSTLEGYSSVTSNALALKQSQQTPGATNTGKGGIGLGVGGWVTVGATFYNDPGSGAYGTLHTPGYHYAELGTASVGSGNATGHGNLALALNGSATPELPNGFKVEIKYGGKSAFATKADRGAGQPPYGPDGAGTPHYAIDLYAPSGLTAALGISGTVDVQVRPAQ